MAFIQAYIDDSASDEGERRLFLAGFIAPAMQWVRFSEDWDRVRRAEPTIEYFKMSEANGLNGQFSRWKPEVRDKKVAAFKAIFERYQFASIHSSISRTDCDELFKPVAPHGFTHPYSYCFQYMIVRLALHRAENGGTIPVEFIFDDQQGLGEEARFFYRVMREGQSKRVRDLLAVDPHFYNDKIMLPLQAADMFAWHIRRGWEEDGEYKTPDFLTDGGVHFGMDIDRATVGRLADGYSKVPGTDQIRGKSAWKKTRNLIVEQIRRGQRPPHILRDRTKNELRLLWRRLLRRVGR